jgi:hypothetical protein
MMVGSNLKDQQLQQVRTKHYLVRGRSITDILSRLSTRPLWRPT